MACSWDCSAWRWRAWCWHRWPSVVRDGGTAGLDGTGRQRVHRQPAAGHSLRPPRPVAQCDGGHAECLESTLDLVIVFVVYGTSVQRKQAVGLLLGFAGAVGLMSLRDGTGDVHWLPAAMVVLATVGYGLSINVVATDCEVGPVTISAVALSDGRLGRRVPPDRWA